MLKELKQPHSSGSVSYPCSLGSGPFKTAIVLGPVSPSWTGATFCAPLVETLNAHGYSVHVIDSIPLLLNHRSWSKVQILGEYVNFIERSFEPPALVAGYALGGTLAMMLAPIFSNTPDVISISGPGFANGALRYQIGVMIFELECGRLDRALQLLAQAVAPMGVDPLPLHFDQFEEADPTDAIDRMIAGFEFLLTLDVRAGLTNFDGRLLAVIGELSKLANRETLGFHANGRENLTIAEIPGAGMRVLLEAQGATIQAINDWIINEKENSYFAR